MQKRIISLFLVLILLVGMVPYPVQAVESDSALDSSDVTIEGTNGFGALLSEDIQTAYEEENEYDGGYSVIGLEIQGNTATVEYSSLEEAVLVVALYTEDGLQMLTSGKTTVSPEETAATVTIEGEMPEYFMASAYLMDTYDFSPLCASYDTPMYTREMQELLASTVEDYEADRVLNLDDDPTTNFAVYTEDTIVIEEQAGVNTVASVNDETATYVIENADESITSLQEGDIFAYPYGENEILIVKVATISVDGTTATITGAEMELEEAFSHVKIETSGDTADIEYQEGSAEEGVTFEGLASEGNMTRALDGSASAEKSLKYTLDKKLKDEATYGEVEVKVQGSLGLKFGVEFSFYVSWSRQFFELETKTELKADVSVNGKVTGKIGLGSFGFSPVAGVYMDFSPELKLEFSGKITYSVSVSAAVSVTYENGKGFGFHFAPDAESKLEVEGSVFLGIDMNPDVGVVGGAVLDADLSLPVGVKLEAKQAGTASTGTGNGDSVHGCEKCLAMELKFEAEAEAKLKFLKWDKLSLEKKVDFKVKIGDMYYSSDDSRFGWGKCPALDYRVTIQTLKTDGTAAGNVAVAVDGSSVGKTNAQGILVVYVPAGDHHFSATIDGTECYCNTTISKANKVVLKKDGSFGGSGSMGGGFRDQIPGSVTDNGKHIASGTCGENVTWKMTSDGVLRISGTGPMRDMADAYDAPWYNFCEQILRVEIENGITRIGAWAFQHYSNIASITIPDSVTSIGAGAFFGCSNLSEVTIPYGVTSIDTWAFSFCNSLSSVTIPASVTSIDAWAFSDCNSLEGIWVDENNPNYSSNEHGVLFDKNKTELIQAPGAIAGHYAIPASVTSIGSCAFSNCLSLSSVTIPASVTSIGNWAFSFCTSLEGIWVDENNPNYSGNEHGVLFDKNKTELIQAPGNIAGHYAIPVSVTSIGNAAFYFCNSLTSVTIPDSVTSIGEDAFNSCDSLTSMTIPDSVTFIGAGAFAECYNLSDVYYGGTEEQWNAISIGSYNEALTSATIHFNSTAPATLLASTPGADPIPEETATAEIPELYAIFGGEYETEELETYTLKNASFTGLVPNEQYVLLALADLEADDPLAADNLLYIDQAVAGENGTLVFQYVQRVDTDISYVMVCGPSNKNLNNASITFPDMTADGQLQAVDPMVVYDGETLTEGVDYTILGNVSFTVAGNYTCYIRGIHQYTGLVECSYSVTEYKPIENPFVDVFSTDYYYDPVLWAVDKGITTGMTETTFVPGGTCTRAQIVTFLWRANGSPAPAAQTNPFTDVPAGQWYTDAVLWAVGEGITTGTSATTFSPDDGCTRGQVATFLWRSEGEPASGGENIFTDITPGAYYYDAVLWAVENGITNGMGDGTFAPDATCTRGQIVTFLYRAMA